MSRCDACGSRLKRDIEGWCPACGAPLVPDTDSWGLGTVRSIPADALVKRLYRRHQSLWRPAIWIILALVLLGGIGLRMQVLVEAAALDDDAAATLSSDYRPAIGPGTVSDGTTRFLMYDSAAGRFGYADETGAVVIEPRFEQAGQFREGLAPVQLQSDSGSPRYGYIDLTGEVVIEPRYKTAFAFCQGLARVEVAVDGVSLFGFVDRNGRPVIEPRYTTAWDFSEGLARVESYEASGLPRYGFVDRTGAVVIEPFFEEARDFAEGLAAVAVDGRWGYIDRAGTWVIEPRFFYAASFLNWGQAEVDLEDPGALKGSATPAEDDPYDLHQARIDKTGTVVWKRP